MLVSMVILMHERTGRRQARITCKRLHLEIALDKMLCGCLYCDRATIFLPTTVVQHSL